MNGQRAKGKGERGRWQWAMGNGRWVSTLMAYSLPFTMGGGCQCSYMFCQQWRWANNALPLLYTHLTLPSTHSAHSVLIFYLSRHLSSSPTCDPCSHRFPISCHQWEYRSQSCLGNRAAGSPLGADSGSTRACGLGRGTTSQRGLYSIHRRHGQSRGTLGCRVPGVGSSQMER